MEYPGKTVGTEDTACARAGDRRGGDGFAAALPGPGGQFEGLPGARSPALEPAYRGKALLMQRYLAKPAAPPEPLGR